MRWTLHTFRTLASPFTSSSSAGTSWVWSLRITCIYFGCDHNPDFVIVFSCWFFVYFMSYFSGSFMAFNTLSLIKVWHSSLPIILINIQSLQQWQCLTVSKQWLATSTHNKKILGLILGQGLAICPGSALPSPKNRMG